MDISYDKTEDIRVIQDFEWISMELNVDLGDAKEACCESFANVTHIATLGGRGIPRNQYAVEIVQDHGFGRQNTFREYKVGELCEWKDIREKFFDELIQHMHAFGSEWNHGE
jgi:hypothetical protein